MQAKLSGMSSSDTSTQKPRSDLFREAYSINPQIISSYLSEMGFGDISRDAAFIIAALAMKEKEPDGKNLAQRIGITEQEAENLVGVLVGHGYLEFRGSPDEGDQESLKVTQRGHAALMAVMRAAMLLRWIEFPYRQGDIVISTLPKSGTTWMQMICALLIFGTRDLPAPLQDLSPWVDSPFESRDDLYDRLAAQRHRRFIKTHVSLDSIPLDPRATYIVVARHPLDMVVSGFRYHQKLVKGHGMGPSPADGDSRSHVPPAGGEMRKRIMQWVTDPHDNSGGLRSAMVQLLAAWEYRDEKNVILVHYEDLSADLEGQMRHLADQFSISVSDDTWPDLVKAATFKEMQAVGSSLLMKSADPGFFHAGASGAGREVLTSEDIDRYHDIAAQLAPPDFLAWLHHEKSGDE